MANFCHWFSLMAKNTTIPLVKWQQNLVNKLQEKYQYIHKCIKILMALWHGNENPQNLGGV
jgi:hypothetical protein